MAVESGASEESVEYFMATQLFTKDMNRESVKILYLAAELLGSISKKNRAQITEQLTYDGMRLF